MLKFICDRKNYPFMRLWLAQLISQFGERINQMALIGLIAERSPGSTMDLAKLLSFTIIPVFIVGPIAGVYVDRWDHRKTLFLCDIARGVLVMLIPMIFIVWKSLVPIYIIVFLIFCFSRFYVPAKMSILPDLVAKEHLVLANSLMTTTGMLAFVFGCAFGGFLVSWAGARGGFVVNAVTFFVSSLLVISIPHDLHLHFGRKEFIQAGQEALALERSVVRELKEGVRYLARNPGIRFVINLLFTLMAAAGAVYVVIIVFIQECFKSVTRDLGVLAVFLGAGLFIGALAYGRWGKKIPWHKTIFCSLFAGGMMMILFVLMVKVYPQLIVAAALAFFLGLVIGPIFIAANTITLLVSDENMLGKVFSSLEIIIHFAFLVAMLSSSLLSEYVDRTWILVGVGGTFTLLGLLGLFKYRKGLAISLV
ncbi:MAG TPA: MFS transporter [Candidatus Omnitrophota bacterium]|nr:MFS transporter [Candidatus Omnitrophota bacterium]HQO57672.1 MFS transporter [Candidatus Omnitrophota bacterium]HQP12625.1 MFS transporter [Candidatus Omnitrophota bacterium]